ncbi:hypothetical protein D9M70_510150 [compost metagenome]
MHHRTRIAALVPEATTTLAILGGNLLQVHGAGRWVVLRHLHLAGAFMKDRGFASTAGERESGTDHCGGSHGDQFVSDHRFSLPPK